MTQLIGRLRDAGPGRPGPLTPGTGRVVLIHITAGGRGPSWPAAGPCGRELAGLLAQLSRDERSPRWPRPLPAIVGARPAPAPAAAPPPAAPGQRT